MRFGFSFSRWMFAIQILFASAALIAEPQPLDLTKACNMGFRDEASDDGAGGWTDQGGNDFRNMPLGFQTLCSVPFNIVDPGKNNGKSCIVLRGNGKKQFAESVTVPVSRKAGAIVFLHTLAWGDEKPVAKYVVNYADGKTEEIPIRQGKEILPWWGVNESENVKLAVVSKNLSTRKIALHAWQWVNPRPDAEITSIEFRSTDSNGVPVIVAATALDQPVVLKSEYVTQQIEKNGFSWIESEDFKTFNVPPTETDKETKKPTYKQWEDKAFSGGRIFCFNAPDTATLMKLSDKDPGNAFLRDNCVRATYEFNTDKQAKYAIWTRLGPTNVWSPFRWRIDQGAWGQCSPKQNNFLDMWEISFWVTMGWVKMGELELSPGSHILTVEIPKRDEANELEEENGGNELDGASAKKGTKDKKKERGEDESPWGRGVMSDCYVATRIPFYPCGSLKPGELFNTVPWHDDLARNSNLDFTGRKISEDGERERFDLDGIWEMARDQDPTYRKGVTDEVKYREPITEAPRTNELSWMGVMVPHVDERPELSMLYKRWYRKIVSLPRDLHGKRLFISFDEVNYTSSIFINGKLCGTHVGGYVPFSVDITDALKQDGEENEILIGVKGLGYYRQDFLIEVPWSFGVAFMKSMLAPGRTGWSWDCMKALPGSVWMETRGQVSGQSLFAQSKWEPRQLTASAEVSAVKDAFSGKVLFSVLEPTDRKTVMTVGEKAVSVDSGKTVLVELAGAADALTPWWPDRPKLYILRAEIRDSAGRLLDASEQNFGFREISIQDKWFLINGKRYNFRNCLTGDLETLDESLAQWRDYNCNFLRLPMAFNKFFGPKGGQHAALDYMDEHGIPIRYNSQINGMFIDLTTDDPRFWKYSGDYLKEFVKGYRNHPSIIVWVAENELDFISNMGNNQEMKRKEWAMMEAAKALDPSRPMMADGAGDLLGKDEICNWHYPEVGPIVDPNNMAALKKQAAMGVSAIYPGNAFTMEQVATTCASRPWDRKRPLWIGETYFYSGPITWQSWIGGDEAMAGRFAADEASSRFVNLLARGYRWQDVAGFDLFVEASKIPGQEIRNSLAPVAVFTRDYNKNQYTDSEFTRRIKIFNDTLDPAPIHLTWSLMLDGKAADSGESDHTIREGFNEEKTLTIRMPAINGDRAEASLEFSLSRSGKTLFTEKQPISLFSRTMKLEQPSGITLGILDPGGKLAPILTAWGLKFDTISGAEKIPARTGVILVGADALKNNGKAILEALKKFTTAGGRALVLEQDCTYPVEALPFPLKTSPAEGAMAYPRGAHPALAGIAHDDLSVWGASEAVFKMPFMRNQYWPLIVDASTKNGLDLAPIVETPWGKGHIILSQMLITRNLGADPMADHLLAGLLRYLMNLDPRKTTVISLLDPKSNEGKSLDSNGFAFEHGEADELDMALGRASVIVAPGSERILSDLKTAKDLKAFTGRGGWILLQGLAPKALADLGKIVGEPLIMREVGQERCTVADRSEPLMAGLGNEDFYWDKKMSEEKAKEVFFLFGDMPLMSGVFSGAIVCDDVCGLTGDSLLSNGLTSEDHWRYIAYRGDEPVKLDWGQPFPINKVVVRVNRHYKKIAELTLALDGDVKNAKSLPVSKVRGVPTVFEFPPMETRNLTLTASKITSGGLSGWDTVEIYRVLPESFKQKVIPLTRPAGIVKFPMGKGGILLNMTTVAETKGDRVLMQLLNNLGAPRGRISGSSITGPDSELIPASENDRGSAGDLDKLGE